MNYIRRTLEQKIRDISEDYSCLLLVGSRQVGKTTMLEHLMEGTERTKVTLDDVENRRLAKNDPAFFLEMHPAPVLIDEVQYAPELFSYIRIKVDDGAPPGSYWLTGSQAFQRMDLARESLAGRTAIVHMSALSQSELYGDGRTEPLSLTMERLNHRKSYLKPCTATEMYERIWNGSMPGHRSGRYKDRDVFYSSYIQTCIDRDVTDMLPGVDKLLFADFIRAVACRTGHMLNIRLARQTAPPGTNPGAIASLTGRVRSGNGWNDRGWCGAAPSGSARRLCVQRNCYFQTISSFFFFFTQSVRYRLIRVW